MIGLVHDLMAWAPLGLPAYLFVITLVVFIHELGHFLVARACGVRVETFSIGFGRAIVGWNDRHGTRWKISWIPFGGYVKFFGDADAASTPDREMAERISPSERLCAFPYKPLYQRAMIVAAGPVANFILAIAVFTLLFMFVGRLSVPPVVGFVDKASAAAAAGIKPGDIVRAINGHRVTDYDDISQIVSLSPGEDLAVTLVRQGKTLTVYVVPRLMATKDPIAGTVNRVRIGIASDPHVTGKLVRYGPVDALGEACAQTWLIVKTTVSYVGQMITGYADLSQLRGPLGTASVSRKVASFGFLALINLAALLSVSIGLINLFPIPLLDGGHLLYYGCEAVLGRPLGERAQDVGFRIGLAFVLCLMILATWNDLVRLNLF